MQGELRWIGTYSALYGVLNIVHKILRNIPPLCPNQNDLQRQFFRTEAANGRFCSKKLPSSMLGHVAPTSVGCERARVWESYSYTCGTVYTKRRTVHV